MNELDQEALAAKTDESRLNELITGHKSWILRCASEVTHRYITDSDDEWSVALLAFSEAVGGYDKEKGAFRSFAAVVIRRRLLDYLRSEGRHGAEISVLPGAFEGDLPQEDDGGVNLEVRSRVAEASLSEDNTAARTREEIEEVQEKLRAYGFSFYDLPDCSPKAEKTRRGCALAVRALLGDELLLRQMRKSRALPMKELSAQSAVGRRILDRHRRYIIAAAEILSGDYPILSAYVDYIRKV